MFFFRSNPDLDVSETRELSFGKSNKSTILQAQLLQSRRYADQAQQQAVVMAQQHLQVGPNAVTIGLQQSLHKFLCWYSLLFHCLNSLQ